VYCVQIRPTLVVCWVVERNHQTLKLLQPNVHVQLVHVDQVRTCCHLYLVPSVRVCHVVLKA